MGGDKLPTADAPPARVTFALPEDTIEEPLPKKIRSLPAQRDASPPRRKLVVVGCFHIKHDDVTVLTRGFPNFAELFGSLIRWTHQYAETKQLGMFMTRFTLVNPQNATKIVKKLEKLGYTVQRRKISAS